MQKINVFAQFPKGKTFYKSEFCQMNKTIRDILNDCNLSHLGAQVYLDGVYVAEVRWQKTLAELKAKSPAFLSVKYGEPKPDQKR